MRMQREKLASYIGISMQAGYAIIGSDNLSKYNKKLYLALIDASAGKASQKVASKLKERGIEARTVEGLSELIHGSIKIIGFKNKALADEIKKYLN